MALIIGILVLWLVWKVAWKVLKWILILVVVAGLLGQCGGHEKVQHKQSAKSVVPQARTLSTTDTQ